jgi:cell division protein FtsW (lipid II flippase)
VIGWALRRLSGRHPVAALIAQAVFLISATGAMVFVSIRDLRAGRSWVRPVLLLAVLVLIAIRLAASGPRRRI